MKIENMKAEQVKTEKLKKENVKANIKFEEGTNWERLIDLSIFGIMLAAVGAVTCLLFYRQCVESMAGSGLYHSDMKAYILEMQGLDSGYSFPYPVFFKLAALFHLFTSPECAVALATVVLNLLAIVVTKCVLNSLAYENLRGLFKGYGWLGGILISAVSVSLFFVSMVFPPSGIYLPGIKYNYLGVFTANPFHNATYMAARPFAIPAFFMFVKLLDEYEGIDRCVGNNGNGGADRGDRGDRKVLRRDLILFSVFLLAATMTKPSFTIVLVGAAGLIMLYRLFRSKFANLKATLLLGLTFLPTFADLLYQYQGVFVPDAGEEGGVGFCFGRIWLLYCDNIPLAIGLAVGFPILVLLLNHKELKTNTFYRFSWQIYLMSFAMAFLLYEKGFREPDFNFSWGYMYGIFFAFLGSVLVLLRATAQKKKPLWLILQWGALGWHLVCGLYYFYGIFQGRMYY